MKTVKHLLAFLMIILLAVFLCGCSQSAKAHAEKAIKKDLDLLKNLDSETTMQYISYQELFPDSDDSTELSADIKEVFSLFFQNFDYKILNIDVGNDTNEATATLRLSTIDAYSLAEDYNKASLKNAIINAAASDNATTEETTDSMVERYLLLDKLLKENTYDTVDRECSVKLHNTGRDKEEWEIIRSHSLENDLVGGLMTYLSDNDLLSPEETLTIYLTTLKTMDTKQLGNYLGIESLFSSSDTDKNSIATALVEQFHQNFDFEITSCNEESYTASIQTEITTFDSNAILTAYQAEQETYLNSADAVIDGSTKRYEKSLQLLLTNIKSNTATRKTSAVFHLTNDGVSWKLQDSNTSIGNAIFGTLSSSPVSE